MLITTHALFGSVYYESNIEHNAKMHSLKICIPETYNPDFAYPLIVGLHYCGGSAQGYRDALRNLSDSLNVIIACPDNSSSEITPSLSGLITIAIDSMKTMYNIDEDEVFLTGMSCNGKATLQFGLDKIYNFKGVFPWVPYINKSDLALFDVESDMLTTLAVGTNDSNLSTILSLYDSLKSHNNEVNLVLVENVGHTLGFSTFPDEMIRCYQYINDTNSIQISQVSDVEMLDNEEKNVELTIESSLGSELEFRVLSSKPKNFPFPEFSLINADGVITLNMALKPVSGKAGTYYIVVEATEIGGDAIEQMVFKVSVEARVSSETIKSTDHLLKVFPNPFNEQLYIDKINGLSEIRIVDTYGKTVFKAEKNAISSPIDLGFLPSGFYDVLMVKDGTMSNHKVLKTK